MRENLENNQLMLYSLVQYRADFPSGLQNHATFVDLAPNLYEISEDILERQIQLVLSFLKEVFSLLTFGYLLSRISFYQNTCSPDTPNPTQVQ